MAAHVEEVLPTPEPQPGEVKNPSGPESQWLKVQLPEVCILGLLVTMATQGPKLQSKMWEERKKG